MAISKFYKRSIIFIKLIRESVSFAFSQLRGDKFRSFLSLLGVSIGIFSIVAIFTAVDSLQNAINGVFSSFSNNMLVVSKWPMSSEDENGEESSSLGGGEWRWWDYMKRPNISYQNYKFLVANSKLAEDIALASSTYHNVKYKKKSSNNTTVISLSYNYSEVTKTELSMGRFFTKDEENNSSAVAILGNEVANTIFGDANPLGEIIKISGRQVMVIGVTKKQEVASMGIERSVLVPLGLGKYFANLDVADNEVFAKPKEGVSDREFKEELIKLLRACRRLEPGEKNDFSVSSISFLQNVIDNVFNTINLVGWIIASFSLLIGGFGIANIMFVSVKERTNIIGIQKALGAKKYVILTQFLVESAVLAIAGGAIGILLVFLIVAGLNATVLVDFTAFSVSLSLVNIIWGLLISTVIGLLSGVIPAMSAASLNPVDAINSK